MVMLRNALNYFDRAVRDGSIRKASESLHVASSAINRQLLQLEEEMGVPLFVRLPRGIRPTTAGETLLGYVRRWNREAEQLAREIHHLKGGLRGTLRIAAAEGLTSAIVPRAMVRLNQQYPMIEFALTAGDHASLGQDVLGREADVLVGFDLADAGPAHRIDVLDCPIGVLTARNHPLGRLGSVSLADCLSYPVIAPRAGWPAHSALHELHAPPRSPIRIVARAERISMLKSMVQQGLGIAFLSRIGLADEIAAGLLQWMPLRKHNLPPATVSVLTARGRVSPPYLDVFVRLLSEELQSEAR